MVMAGLMYRSSMRTEALTWKTLAATGRESESQRVAGPEAGVERPMSVMGVEVMVGSDSAEKESMDDREVEVEAEVEVEVEV
jgi:hypothetical protein